MSDQPTIQFAQANYDVHGAWHHMTPQTRTLLKDIQENPDKLAEHAANGIRTSRFLNYIQEGGEDSFGDAQDGQGNPVKLARWQDENNITHEYEIKAGIFASSPNEMAMSNSSTPVPVGGTTGEFIANSQGHLCFVVQKVESVTTDIGTATTALGILEFIAVKALTRIVDGMKTTAADAAAVAEAVGNAEREADEAVATIARIESAIKIIKFLGTASTILGVLTLLVDGFFALFHKMTCAFSVWNETDLDFEWSITHTGKYTHCINQQNNLNIENWNNFPGMNKVDDGLIPLGGGLTYDKVAAVELVFANGDKGDMVSAANILFNFSVRTKGTQNTVFVASVEVPLTSDNKMSVSADGSKQKSSDKQQSFDFSVDGKQYVVNMATDQVSGTTNYAGVTGYNYTILLHVTEQ